MRQYRSVGVQPYKNLNRIGLLNDQVEEIRDTIARAFDREVVINDRMGEFWIRDIKKDPSRRGFILRVSSKGTVRALINCDTPGERPKLRKHFEGTVRDVAEKAKDVYRVEQPRDAGKQNCGNVYTFELLRATTQTLHKQRKTVAADLVRLHDWFAHAGYYRIKCAEMK